MASFHFNHSDFIRNYHPAGNTADPPAEDGASTGSSPLASVPVMASFPKRRAGALRRVAQAATIGLVILEHPHLALSLGAWKSKDLWRRSPASEDAIESRILDPWRMGVLFLLTLLAWAVWLTFRLRAESLRLRLAKEELDDKERHHRTLIQLLPDTLYMVQPDGRIVLEHKSGPREIDEDSVVALERSNLHRDKVREALAKGRTVVCEEVIGESRFVECRLVPVPGIRGRYSRVMGILRDVTERKQSERVQAELEDRLRRTEKLHGLGRIAGGVAHDFNNLLTVINGYSEMLLRSHVIDPSVRRQLEGIHSAGSTAADLTHQLLTFGRASADNSQFVDVNALIRDQEGLIRRIVGEKVSVVHSLRSASGVVMADATQVNQILLNLAANARDAMPAGGFLAIETADIELTAATAGEFGVAPGTFLAVSVADTGVGMDEATRKNLFQPFYTTKQVGKGTGLGLATVAEIVKQLGGHIGVESELGEGARFTTYFPLARTPVPSSLAHPVLGEAPHGTETILLVEDQDDVRTVIRDALRQLGYRVLDLASPAEAILLASRMVDPIHLLIADVILPSISGMELVERMRRRRPALRVLYISGCQPVPAGSDSSDEAFLQKPFSIVALGLSVRAVLDGAT